MKPISWKNSKKIAQFDTALAKNILGMLIQSLPEEKQAFSKTYADNDSKQLIHVAHKLYGSCCYVSLPLLKRLLKNTIVLVNAGANDDAISQIPKINQEIDKVISFWELMNNRAAAIFGNVGNA